MHFYYYISIQDYVNNSSHFHQQQYNIMTNLSPKDYETIEEIMFQRKNYLYERCHKLGLDIVGNDSWHKPNAWEYLVNKKHHLIWYL